MSSNRSSAIDVPTVLAIAVIAYLSAKIVHELVGHGFVCIAVGGTLEGVSSSWCACDKGALLPWAVRAERAGGTIANLLVGSALALAAARRIRSGRAGATAYALWLGAAVQLFMGSGYLLVDPLFGFGDWSAFLEGLGVAWRVGAVAAGLGLSIASMGLLLGLLDPFLGADRAQRMWRARKLCLVSYLVVGGGVMTGAALLNVLGPFYALTSALATLGGTSFLAWFYTLADEPRSTSPAHPAGVPRSRPWRIAGAVALVVLLVFGRGLLVAPG